MHAGELPVFSFGNQIAITLTNEFFDDKTDRAKTANNNFRERFKNLNARDYDSYKLQSAIETAIEWILDKKIIGGLVDNLILERGGTIKWISNKKCTLEESPRSPTK